MSPVLVRLLTRGLALGPAITVMALYGEHGVLKLLILSQVILSLQLPFAIVPLIRFTGDSRIMGELVSPAWVRRLAWLAAGGIIALNGWLMSGTLLEWAGSQSAYSDWLYPLMMIVAALYALLLVWITAVPIGKRSGTEDPA
jgi:manganese transport protein